LIVSPKRRIGVIQRTYRHVNRYQNILRVLFKYGFGDLIDSLNIDSAIEIGLNMISRQRKERIEMMSRAERIRRALEELGPTFIKMGQILSVRPDLLPHEFLDELVKLQDNVPSFPSEDVRRILEEELQSTIHDLFDEFDDQPLASASLGQVHKARLRKTGERVVVKVQRPEIQEVVEMDLEIMLHLAQLMEWRLDFLNIYSPTRIVQEFADTLSDEMDYHIEASYIERFHWQFKEEPFLKVPKVFRKLTTSKVLTMEHIEGVKVSRLELLTESGLDKKLIAQRGFDLVLKQIFVHGFFHADPHPGNLFVLPDNRICFVDFGMMGRIDRLTRNALADLVSGIAEHDEVRVTKALLRITETDDPPDRRQLQRDVLTFMDQNVYRPLEDLELEKLLRRSLDIASRHQMRIPPDLFLLVKAITTVEGLGRNLDPDFNAVEQASNVVRHIYLESLKPWKMAEALSTKALEFFGVLTDLPSEVLDLVTQMKRGDLRIVYEHQGLEPMFETHDRISNRITFGLVLASLIVGSALMVLSGVPPLWHEIPILGLVGFLVAGLMGFWLLISILRQSRGRW